MNRLRAVAQGVCIAAILLLTACGGGGGGGGGASPPAAGSLDKSFGTGGIVTTAVGDGADITRAIALQPDGKIVVAGYSSNVANYDFAVARYNANGSLDPTFGNGGKADGGGHDVAYAVALQPDGKIVVAGERHNGSNYDFALTRHNANGSLDTSFDTDGIVITAVGSGDDSAHAIALQPDGKIVVAGYSQNPAIIEAGAVGDFALARYNPDGSLDTTFGAGGIVITVVGVDDDSATAIALQPDGKIVVAGYSLVVNDDFALARYNPDGSLDTTFGTGGIVITPVGSSSDVANAIALQPDGKIVVAGSSFNGANDDFALTRYNANGSLDTSFDADGKVTTSVGIAYDSAYAIALQPDGKIVAAGTSFNFNNDKYDFALTRYNANGSLDTSFDADGIVTTSVGGINDFAYAIALQPDGKIVAAGHSFGVTHDFALARYHP